MARSTCAFYADVGAPTPGVILATDAMGSDDKSSEDCGGFGVVVANDTGPAHMAAGVGARLLSIWGPVDAARWAPWGSSVTLMRRGPGEWSSVDEVISAVDQALP